MRRKLTKLTAVLVLILYGPASIIWASAEITLKDLDLPASIPITSTYYRVTSIEPGTLPGFLKFKVSSSHANYEVEGVAPLKKLLHEIDVIERVKQENQGSGFFDGFSDSVAKTGSGFVKLVTSPVESGKGLGKAIGKLGHKIGGVFSESAEGEKSSFGEKVMGSSERELANKFTVDVYTRNPYMRELLARMAKARMGGKGAASVVSFLLPVAGLVSIALTASGVNGTADQFVNDSDRGEVYEANEKAFDKLGIPAVKAQALLNSKIYTPREATYLRFYLEKLKSVKGYQQIFEKALKADTVFKAQKILFEAQITADKITEGNGFHEIVCEEEGILINRADSVALASAFDYLDSSELGDKVFSRIQGYKKKWGKGFASIWNAGKISQGFSAKALLGGIKTEQWLGVR